jgi:5-aminopentanamidase
MSSPGTIRMAAVQMEPKLGKVEENLDRILAGLEQAAADGAKLVVFPECALSGYGFGSREEGLAHAVASDGHEVRYPTSQLVTKIVQSCHSRYSRDGTRPCFWAFT